MNGGETLFDTVLQDQSVEGGPGDFFAALMRAAVLTPLWMFRVLNSLKNTKCQECCQC